MSKISSVLLYKGSLGKFSKNSAKDFMHHKGSYFENKEDYQLTNGENNYEITEMEVFKLI